MNNPLLEGRIYIWFLLFQEFQFEVIVNRGKHRLGYYQLSRKKSGESSAVVEPHNKLKKGRPSTLYNHGLVGYATNGKY